MTDLPSRVFITEEGPREGFQIEKGPITTERKIELIDALSQTGVGHIVTVSFVNPKVVPQMADAEAVVEGFQGGPWCNLQCHRPERARRRARAARRKSSPVPGMITAVASAAFLAPKSELNARSASRGADQEDQIVQGAQRACRCRRVGCSVRMQFPGRSAGLHCRQACGRPAGNRPERGRDPQDDDDRRHDGLGYTGDPSSVSSAPFRTHIHSWNTLFTSTIPVGWPSPMPMPNSRWGSGTSTRPSAAWAVARLRATPGRPETLHRRPRHDVP